MTTISNTHKFKTKLWAITALIPPNQISMISETSRIPIQVETAPLLPQEIIVASIKNILRPPLHSLQSPQNTQDAGNS